VDNVGVQPVEPGAQIHTSDPFATPEPDRSPVRRFRGRMPAAVTLWTTAGPDGLTVSSTLVADGEPARVLGLIDAESDFWDAVSRNRTFAVVPLGEADQQLADRFAGLMPAPGGPFATGTWIETGYGPVPEDAGIWAGCRIEAEEPVGWSLLVRATIETFGSGPERRPLIHYRGRYHRLG
jgi:3-hydroxy-9,10-secoandrosta-1,3,5(10)-triene-9,17-dione monooxygenase reductase component